MYYEINVSLKGKHFFATAERSIIREERLKELLLVFNDKFPASEGYTISACLYRNSGQELDVNKITNRPKNTIK